MKADLGQISSLEVLSNLGFKGDLAKLEKTYLDTLEIDTNFYDFANKVKERDKLGLISDDSIEWSKYLRKKYDINRYFDAVTISGQVKIKKPDIRIFEHSLKQLKSLPANCTYIDDRVENVEAALALGMKGILFNTRRVNYDGLKVNDFNELSKLLSY